MTIIVGTWKLECIGLPHCDSDYCYSRTTVNKISYMLTQCCKLLESELRSKIMDLTEQNNELKRKWEQQTGSSTLQGRCDQPAFTSSPAYKSLMASVGLVASSGQVRSRYQFIQFGVLCLYYNFQNNSVCSIALVLRTERLLSSLCIKCIPLRNENSLSSMQSFLQNRFES